MREAVPFAYIVGGAVALLVAVRVTRRFLGLARWNAAYATGDPSVWEDVIRAFEAEDRHNPPPAGMLVFTGSSSIRFWETLARDMAPLPALNRGFGGSRIADVAHYADRIVTPYRPRAVVFYAGENDIALSGKSAEHVRNDFAAFCVRVHAALPDVPIYFISIKAPKRRRRFWPEMRRANELIRALCDGDNRLHYIDVVPAMLDANGNPRRDLFRWDGIHLNAKGYALWTATVKPVLLEAFASTRMLGRHDARS